MTIIPWDRSGVINRIEMVEILILLSQDNQIRNHIQEGVL
jgi:hypothetical protein